jgi:UTP--glucose-1-phosphate uridylyltransferase
VKGGGITSAVVAAAGSASRMWPASKVFPKELFPLGRFPALAYVIAELVEAGIHDIVVIVRDDNADAVQMLLDTRIPPPASIENLPVVRRFRDVVGHCRFTFIAQSGPYGNGTPLLNGFEAARADACIFAFADDIVFGENVSRGLASTFARTRCPVLSAQVVPESQMSKFGIIDYVQRGGATYVARFVEKPKPSDTTSRLASVGRYLVTREVVEILSTTKLGRGDELWLSDAFVELLGRGRDIAAFPITNGQWFTVGTPEGFRAALLAAMRLEQLVWGEPAAAAAAPAAEAVVDITKYQRSQ